MLSVNLTLYQLFLHEFPIQTFTVIRSGVLRKNDNQC